MQIRLTASAYGLIINFSIALFHVYTEFGIDSPITISEEWHFLINHIQFFLRTLYEPLYLYQLKKSYTSGQWLRVAFPFDSGYKEILLHLCKFFYM